MRRQTPVGHHPKPNPPHTQPLATPQASTHQHRRATQHNAPDPPASGATT